MNLGEEQISAKTQAMLGRPEKSEVLFFVVLKYLHNAIFMEKVYCCVHS